MVTAGAGPDHNHITKNQARISKTPDNTGIDGRYRHKNNLYPSLVVCWIHSAVPENARKPKTILIDSSAITLDLNWFKRTITKAQLATRDFDWGYSKTHGYYIGYKLTLALEYPSLKPLWFLIHRGSPLDAPLFDEILDELKRRRIARIGDRVVCDKG